MSSSVILVEGKTYIWLESVTNVAQCSDWWLHSRSAEKRNCYRGGGITVIGNIAVRTRENTQRLISFPTSVRTRSNKIVSPWKRASTFSSRWDSLLGTDEDAARFRIEAPHLSIIQRKLFTAEGTRERIDVRYVNTLQGESSSSWTGFFRNEAKKSHCRGA